MSRPPTVSQEFFPLLVILESVQTVFNTLNLEGSTHSAHELGGKTKKIRRLADLTSISSKKGTAVVQGRKEIRYEAINFPFFLLLLPPVQLLFIPLSFGVNHLIASIVLTLSQPTSPGSRRRNKA